MDIKKWLFRTNEDGYINRENEKLENILMIIFFAIILVSVLRPILAKKKGAAA